jgi:hypothetical protein
MEKKLQDYLHYYIGCKMTHKDHSGKPYILIYDTIENAIYYGDKPILRKLDSMDDADIKSFLNWDRLNELYVDVSYEKIEHAIKLNYSIPVDGEADYPQSVTIMPWIELRSDQFHHLIKHGFDVFGLIESGLAIDASTLTK